MNFFVLVRLWGFLFCVKCSQPSFCLGKREDDYVLSAVVEDDPLSTVSQYMFFVLPQGRTDVLAFVIYFSPSESC